MTALIFCGYVAKTYPNFSAIKLDAFTNKIKISDARNEPAKIFARLTSGDIPILGAKIFATVQK